MDTCGVPDVWRAAVASASATTSAPPIVRVPGTRLSNISYSVAPGAAAAAVPLLDGQLFARAHWPSEPQALGSYTCNQPGYFTTLEGWLGEPAGNLAFAGEHTDSFHNFQGFIEGAAQSGIRAAEYLLSRKRRAHDDASHGARVTKPTDRTPR